MSAPTQITVTYLTYSNANPAVITTATATIPIPSSLLNLDSGQTAAGQTGYSALETLLAGISKREGITFADANGVSTFIPLSVVTKITSP